VTTDLVASSVLGTSVARVLHVQADANGFVRLGYPLTSSCSLVCTCSCCRMPPSGAASDAPTERTAGRTIGNQGLIQKRSKEHLYLDLYSPNTTPNSVAVTAQFEVVLKRLIVILILSRTVSVSASPRRSPVAASRVR